MNSEFKNYVVLLNLERRVANFSGPIRDGIIVQFCIAL